MIYVKFYFIIGSVILAKGFIRDSSYNKARIFSRPSSYTSSGTDGQQLTEMLSFKFSGNMANSNSNFNIRPFPTNKISAHEAI